MYDKAFRIEVRGGEDGKEFIAELVVNPDLAVNPEDHEVRVVLVRATQADKAEVLRALREAASTLAWTVDAVFIDQDGVESPF